MLRPVFGPTASVKVTARWMTVSPGVGTTDLPWNFAAREAVLGDVGGERLVVETC